MLTSEDRLNLDCMVAAYMVLIERSTREGNKKEAKALTRELGQLIASKTAELEELNK